MACPHSIVHNSNAIHNIKRLLGSYSSSPLLLQSTTSQHHYFLTPLMSVRWILPLAHKSDIFDLTSNHKSKVF